MAIVRNINGSSDNYPPAGYTSWIEYWECQKGRKVSMCSNVKCTGSADVGGHVKKVNGSNEWYIVPICYACNNLSSSTSYEVNDKDLLRVN